LAESSIVTRIAEKSEHYFKIDEKREKTSQKRPFLRGFDQFGPFISFF